MNVSIEELCIAYRRAKKEAFRDPNCAHGLKFARFEANLARNLIRLQRDLNREQPEWQNSIDFTGGVTCIPKSIERPAQIDQGRGIHCQESDPIDQWQRECSNGRRARADFRPVIDATVPFLIVSALWIQRVGHLYDATLDTRYAVGSRLRRWRPAPDFPVGTPGPINPISHDLFQPYYNAYGRWRSRGLRAMRRELEEGHRIVAVTMDLQRFYHQVDASFLLHQDYLNAIGLNLDTEQREFTGLLIRAIQTWNEVTHATFNNGMNGLPVGLPASQLVANVLLQQFDRHVAAALSPVYYSRYVDDVFLVLRHPARFESGEEFIEWLGHRLHPLASTRQRNDADPNDIGLAIQLDLPYAANSQLLFVGRKQKIFQLEGPRGIDLIGPIEEQIRRQTSEHRDMPKLPRSENEMAHKALLVTPDASLDPDALRKADAVTLRRSGFAMLLSDVEAHVRDLDPNSWRSLRHEFIGLVHRQLLAPAAFFDYFRYYPRIVGVMVACGDLGEARRFVHGFVQLLRVLEETSQVSGQPTFQESLRVCCRNLARRIVEAVLQSAIASSREVRLLIADICEFLSPELECPRSDAEISEAVERFRKIDWSRNPYASQWLNATDDEVSPARPSRLEVREALKIDAIDAFRVSAGLAQPYWPAISFPTRPIPQREITTRAPALLENGLMFSSVIQGLRGTWMPPFTGLNFSRNGNDAPLTVIVPNQSSPRPLVAITSLDVSDHEWAAAAAGSPALTLERYRRLNSLLDSVVACDPRPEYVLFPECSIPRRWALSMATRVLGRGVSVIGGLEYRQDTADNSLLHNEALVGLRSTFPGYPTNLCYFQPKHRAAWHEREELLNLYGKRLPDLAAGAHPVYVHGRFCFGLLICSELTDIENRSRFQGKVDALFIPEWNSDLESFSALVESSALDVHCFIVQANNRRFGDSRIRVPFKVPHARDVVRVKGGENDYFVVGRIDFMDLRRFQSRSTPPLGDGARFKPFPLGFPSRLSARRRTIPY